MAGRGPRGRRRHGGRRATDDVDDTHDADDTDGDAPRLAFDHARILRDAVERVRAKLEYTTLALAFVDEPFSLADVRRVYLAVWGDAPDLPNFRRKVLATPGFVVAERRAATAPSRAGGRPPELYRRGPAAAISPPLARR